jgi:transposase-like protein
MTNKPKNRYYRGSKLSEKKFLEILKYFCLDLTAKMTSELSNVNKNTTDKIYRMLREKILKYSEKETSSAGIFELDESYFGAKRVRGKRGRGASGKIPVFGLLKRGGKVHVQIVKNCSRKELIPIIKGKILEGSEINTDGWKAYDSLVLNGYKHHRVYHSHDEFVRGKNHVNGIESFRSFAKRRLAKFNGTSVNFELHLQECQFRYNHKDLYKSLKNLIVQSTLN